MAKILIIEDDAALSAMIERTLKHERHTVEQASNGRDGLDKLQFYEYDLVILDIGLPEINGVDLCKRFRDRGGQTPIIMLTAKKEMKEKKVGFDVGADDYLTKPFEMDELVVRVRALLRRSRQTSGDVLRAGDIVLDRTGGRVTKNGTEIHLLPKEFALLAFLMRYPDQIFSPEVLVNRVWESEAETSPSTIRIYITRIRSKIDTPGTPSLIATVHGMGYRFEMPN
jgi:DNA-binding response OmpR family regulator